MLRAVVFDLFNTLVDGLDDGRIDTLRLMAADMDVDPDLFIERFHAAYPRRIIGTPATFAEQCREAAMEVGGVPTPAQIDAAVARRLTWSRQLFTISKQTLRVLGRLRDDCYALALLSNLSADSATVLRETTLLDSMDAVALSCEIGVAKPDSAIYLSVTSQLGLEPRECLFVGDGADSELRGAEAVGMHAIRTREYADSDPSWDGPTIVRLAELLDHI